MNIVQPIRDKAVIDGVKAYLRLRSMRDYLFFCFGLSTVNQTYSGCDLEWSEERTFRPRKKRMRMINYSSSTHLFEAT